MECHHTLRTYSADRLKSVCKDCGEEVERYFPPTREDLEAAVKYYQDKAALVDELVAALQKAADTFADTKTALGLLRHNTIALAMQMAEDATRAAIAKAEALK